MRKKFYSLETLAKRLKISPLQAQEVVWVCKNQYAVSSKPEELLQFKRNAVVGDAVPYCDTFVSVQKWCRQCYNTPSLVERQMCALNEILGGHGVEAIQEGDGYIRRRRFHHDYDRHFWRDTVLLYVNQGDTYAPTLAYDVREDRFIITSWGDWYDQNMREVRSNDY